MSFSSRTPNFYSRSVLYFSVNVDFQSVLSLCPGSNSLPDLTLFTAEPHIEPGVAHSRCSIHTCCWSCPGIVGVFFRKPLKACLMSAEHFLGDRGIILLMRYALYNSGVQTFDYHPTPGAEQSLRHNGNGTRNAANPPCHDCAFMEPVQDSLFCHCGIFMIPLCLKSNYHPGTRAGFIILRVLSCKCLKGLCCVSFEVNYFPHSN